MSTLKTNNIQHVDRSDPSIIINTDGSVSIAGTATYEDVTSIDSVGIITGRSLINAQKQVHVGTGVSVKAGGINVTAGITTIQALQATTGTFSGAVNGTLATAAQPNITSLGTLTSLDVNGGLGIAESLFHIGDTDTRIAFSADNRITFDTSGSERLRIDDNGKVLIATDTTSEGGANADELIIGKTTDDANHGLTIVTPSNRYGTVAFSDGSGGTNRGLLEYNHSTDFFRIYVAGGERLRIDSSGRLLLGTTTEGYSDADDLTIATSTHTGITIRSGTSSLGTIAFSDATSGQDEYKGFIQYNHSQDTLYLGSSHQTRLTCNADGNSQFTGIVTATTFVPTEGQLANRNLVINGDMRISQRATTFTGSYGTSNINQYYKTVDRILVATSGLPNTDVTSGQVTLSSGDPYDVGFRYAFQMKMGYQSSTPSSVQVQMQYRIEAQDIANSGWKHTSSSSFITLSFWAKSTVSQTFYGLLRTLDGTQYKYPFSYALTANTWKKVEVTVPGNSNLTLNNDTGEGLRINLSPYLGTDSTDSGVTLNTWSTHSNSAKTPDQTATWYQTNNATFEVTGLQLEVGQIATPFEFKSYQHEFLRCCRYFWKSVGRPTAAARGAGSSAYLASLATPVPLRAEPTIASGTDSNNGSFNIRVYEYDGISDSSNTPTVGTRGWTAGNTHVTIYQTGHSVVDDRVITIYQTGGYLDFGSEI